MNEKVKDILIQLLLSADKGSGMKQLVDHMNEQGFFTAPCSGKYHLSEEGGLAQHSLNVYMALEKLNIGMDAGIPESSIIVCSILHDLGKMGAHGKPNYIPKYVRSKSKNKETGEYDMVRSTAEPYQTNPDLMYEEHEIRSVIIANKYISLTEEEESAILHHNGLYGKLDSSFGNANYAKTPLAFLLHTADMYCSRFIEVEED